MKSNILKSLTNNMGYKILALIFAFTLWLIVYNTSNPIKTEFHTINVTITNGRYLEEQNKYYEIINGTNKVSFSIRGESEVVKGLDASDFTAYADLSTIVIDETGTQGTIEVDIVCKDASADIKISSTSNICKVSLENLMSKQFVVTAAAEGTVSQGHALGEVSVTAPNVLRVSGPESVVKQIAGIVATIDVDGMSMNLTDNVVPIPFDAEGQEIDTTRLDFSNETVTVSAKILKTKEVPISVNPEGTPASGYAVTSITSSPTTVAIKGSSAVLNTISAIEIPSELIDITDENKDVKAVIDITEYLGEGVELVDPSASNVEIEVTISAIKNKTFSISSKNIVVSGLETGMKLEFVHTSESVVIFGLEADINALAGSTIYGNIDVKDLGLGTHQVELQLDLDDTKYSHTEILVDVIISEEIPETETEETETGGTETEDSESEVPSESRYESEE